MQSIFLFVTSPEVQEPKVGRYRTVGRRRRSVPLCWRSMFKLESVDRPEKEWTQRTGVYFIFLIKRGTSISGPTTLLPSRLIRRRERPSKVGSRRDPKIPHPSQISILPHGGIVLFRIVGGRNGVVDVLFCQDCPSVKFLLCQGCTSSLSWLVRWGGNTGVGFTALHAH